MSPLPLLLALTLTQGGGQDRPILKDAPYPVFETDKISPAEHRARREKVMAEMGPGTMAVFLTNPVRNRNNDVDFMFRADSSFLYLTGFEEPEAALVLIPDGVTVNGNRVREALFVNESDAMSLTWLGYRMGSARVPGMLGLDAAFPNQQFNAMLPTLAAGATEKLITLHVPPDASGSIMAMSRQVNEFREGNGFKTGKELRRFVQQLRAVKSPAEIAILKKVSEISARGHIEAMRSAKPGMREWEINGLVKYMFAREGCEYEGYPPICGSGPNSTILHYQSNRGPMKNGDVMCMDTAGEYHGYTADVTRSFPINGKWSKEQLAIYNVVYAAQKAGIANCLNGKTMRDIETVVTAEIVKGLKALGVISADNEVRQYYMHGFGHGLGLDVHDPVPNGGLKPGACLTVEPGIYIKAGSPCDKKWWNIGIRIEDDILVTTGAPVNMSILAPRDPAVIEKVMAETGIGNAPFKPLAKALASGG